MKRDTYNPATQRIEGCESQNHAQCDPNHAGSLWTCPRCNKAYCAGEGADLHDDTDYLNEICDTCYATVEPLLRLDLDTMSQIARHTGHMAFRTSKPYQWEGAVYSRIIMVYADKGPRHVYPLTNESTIPVPLIPLVTLEQNDSRRLYDLALRKIDALTRED